MNDIIHQLMEARNNRGLSQMELAQNTNLDTDLIQKIEDGSYDPTLSELLSISQALNWSFKIGNVMI